MKLNYNQIEQIADYMLYGFHTRNIEKVPIQIDKFAKEYLGLSVSYAKLSDDGNICGLTTYSDTEFTYVADGEVKKAFLKRNQVILDKSFIFGNSGKKNRRKFTLAHECAHQILFALEPESEKMRFRKLYYKDKTYSLRDLKSKEDFNEWQANALGAALLMPKNLVINFMKSKNIDRKLVSFGPRIHCRDSHILADFCNEFEVSRSAGLIRLKQLGYVQTKPFIDYRNIVEVQYESYDS